jgi:RHS repeat-associated protein
VLTDDGRHAYEVDACHRRVAKIDKVSGARTEYAWDDWDRLRQIKRPDGLCIRYFYDAFGRRVRKELWRPLDQAELVKALTAHDEGPPASIPDETRIVSHYLWDSDVLAGEILPDRRRVHVYAPGSFVPLLHSEGEHVYLVVTDRLGAPRELVDERGALVWAATYLAWGQIDAEWRQTPTSPRSPFRQLGHYHDPETGLFATRFRMWDPDTARWLSPDPLRLLGGHNLFAFNGSPLSFVDPLGLCLKGEVEADGKTVFSGEYESGAQGTIHEGKGSLNQRQALDTHTEPKFLADARAVIDSLRGPDGELPPGTRIVMEGELPPCTPGCQPAIRRFVDEQQVPARYTDANGTTWDFTPANDARPRAQVMQTETAPDGTSVTRRYWQSQPSGNWTSKVVPE